MGARRAIIVVITDGTKSFAIPGDAPTAVEMLIAVRGGDVDVLRRLLLQNPDLARARFGGRGGTSTALHFVTDWPGYFPNGPDIVKLLIDAGADPDELTTGGDSERPGPGFKTPLHYAASSDDVEVALADPSTRASLAIHWPSPPSTRMWIQVAASTALLRYPYRVVPLVPTPGDVWPYLVTGPAQRLGTTRLEQ